MLSKCVTTATQEAPGTGALLTVRLLYAILGHFSLYIDKLAFDSSWSKLW